LKKHTKAEHIPLAMQYQQGTTCWHKIPVCKINFRTKNTQYFILKTHHSKAAIIKTQTNNIVNMAG